MSRNIMAATQKLSVELEEQFGSTDCRPLCGLDLTTLEGRRELSERVKSGTCRKFVEQGARLLARRLNEVLPSESRTAKLASSASAPL